MPPDLPTILAWSGLLVYIVGFWVVVIRWLGTPRCPVCWRPAFDRDLSECKPLDD